MELRIVIKMDNAAFEDHADAEAARILRDLAKRIEGDRYFDAGHEYAIHDANGNSVGFAGVYAKTPSGRPAYAQGDHA